MNKYESKKDPFRILKNKVTLGCSGHTLHNLLIVFFPFAFLQGYIKGYCLRRRRNNRNLIIGKFSGIIHFPPYLLEDENFREGNECALEGGSHTHMDWSGDYQFETRLHR